MLLLTAHPAWKLGMDVMSYYITYVGTPSNYLTMRKYKSTENTNYVQARSLSLSNFLTHRQGAKSLWHISKTCQSQFASKYKSMLLVAVVHVYLCSITDDKSFATFSYVTEHSFDQCWRCQSEF